MKFGIWEDVALSISLVDMYAKCGSIDAAAVCVVKLMSRKNLAPWNAMIGGYSRHKLGKDASEELERR